MGSRTRGRGNQVIRQWTLLRALERRRQGARAQELAEELGQGVRTIYRDLRQLQDAGFPVEAAGTGDESRWSLGKEYRLRLPEPLTLLEACALLAARGALAPLASTIVGAAAESALQKVRRAVPGDVAALLEKAPLLAVLSPGETLGDRDPTVTALVRAIEEHRTVATRYAPASRGGRPEARDLDPYQLFLDGGLLYLAGYCHQRGDVRIFRVDRFRLVNVTERTFRPPPGFELGEYLDGAFRVFRGPKVAVRLRVRGRTLDLLRSKKVHRSQALTDVGPGEAELRLHVPVSPELRTWVLAFGAEAEVLEPPDLRRHVAEAHAAAAARYAPDTGRRIGELRSAAYEPQR